MVALTRFLGALVRWLTRSRRSKIGLVVVPILVVIALLAPHELGVSRNTRESRAAGGGPTVSLATPASAPTGLPDTSGPPPSGPPVPSRGVVPLPGEAATVATSYAVTVNSHDARPGKDAGPLDAYRRARPFVTDEVFAQITAASNRGDYEWTRWTAAQAQVTVRDQRAAVPDGAPAPTADTAYVRVRYQQVVTPAAGGAAPQSTDGALSMIVKRGGDGRWLVSQLLADT